MGILTLRAIASASKYADTIAFKAEARKVYTQNAYFWLSGLQPVSGRRYREDSAWRFLPN